MRIGSWWLTRDSCEDIAVQLNIPIVPVIGQGPLTDAVELVRKGFTSTIAHNEKYMAEGLIMKPVVDLFDRGGRRIVAKIKHSDFRK